MCSVIYLNNPLFLFLSTKCWNNNLFKGKPSLPLFLFFVNVVLRHEKILRNSLVKNSHTYLMQNGSWLIHALDILIK
jgi:hypothetical protein